MKGVGIPYGFDYVSDVGAQIEKCALERNNARVAGWSTSTATTSRRCASVQFDHVWRGVRAARRIDTKNAEGDARESDHHVARAGFAGSFCTVNL